MNDTLAANFAAFGSKLEYEQIPVEIRDAAVWHLVDSIGVCLAGAAPSESSGQVARRLAEQWKSSEGAAALGLGARCRPDLAALINGSLIQALEMDDKHGSSLARPGSTIVPAVLAVAEAQNLIMRDLITALVVGYEVMIRLGFVAAARFLERGYHTSSLLGGFGAAIAVGRLRKSGASQIVDSLGIAGTMASGIQESTRTGSTSKILHGGWGAHIGIIANELAVAGITGPSTVFEGQFGFFRTHLSPIKGELDWQAAVQSLGTKWHLHDTAYKPYPCCQLLHAFIEGAKQISGELAQDRLSIQSITEISCYLAEPGLTLVTKPEDRKWAPELPHEARFSLPFVVATTLLFREVGLDSFSATRLREPAIQQLASLVHAEEDRDSDYPQHCPAIIEVQAGGKTYRRHIRFHPGCPETPLSKEDVIEKFARNTRWAFGDLAPEVGRALAATSAGDSVRSLIDRSSVVELGSYR